MKNFIPLLAILSAGRMIAVERVDNVLAQLVPDNSVTLAGMRMEQLKATPLFQKLVAQQKLQQLDDFAKETGFDPRRDVRDLLLAYNGKQTVVLARGSFHVTSAGQFKKTGYHGYTVWSNGQAGFCILDRTLAAAGPLPVLDAALDQYKLRSRTNAAALVGRARAIPEDYQIWAVTSGGADFIADNLPRAGGNGPDFSRIIRSLQNTLFEADFRKGLSAVAEGSCLSLQDAKSLGDAARGVVGLGRLNTPENQPDLLRLWDGIKVEQQDRRIKINADIGQDLIDQLLKMLQSGGMPGHVRPGPAKASPKI